MRIPIRKTTQGIEYWCTKEKRIIILPTGVKPDFETSESPKSMLQKDAPKTDYQTEVDPEKMNVEQLLAYAKEKEVDVPGNMKKEETIRAHIVEQLATADAE